MEKDFINFKTGTFSFGNGSIKSDGCGISQSEAKDLVCERLCNAIEEAGVTLKNVGMTEEEITKFIQRVCDIQIEYLYNCPAKSLGITDADVCVLLKWNRDNVKAHVADIKEEKSKKERKGKN